MMQSLAYEMGYMDGTMGYYINSYRVDSKEWADYDSGYHAALEEQE